MMRTPIGLLFALMALAGSATAFAGLPGGVSGIWYNPAQSGHGLSLDVLAGDRAIAIWNVFDDDGKPLTLYIEAQIDGRRLTGQAYAPRGMRFGSFNPAELQLPVWGEVAISFGSCDRAELSWQSAQAGVSNGRMPLVRLTTSEGSDCALPAENALPFGLYVGERDGSVSLPATDLLGMVDREGRLWGFDRRFRSNGAPIAVPGSAWLGNITNSRFYRIHPGEAIGDELPATQAAYPAMALGSNMSGGFGEDNSGVWRLGAPGGAAAEFDAATSGNPIPIMGSRWRRGAPPATRLVAPVDLDQLQGRYTVLLRNQFFEYSVTVTIGADGSLCLPAELGPNAAPCRLRGTVTTPDGEFGLIDFTAADVRFPGLASYTGRGWLLDTASGRELNLVGDNGTIGLVVMAPAR